MAEEHSGETKPKVEQSFQLVVKDQTGGEARVCVIPFTLLPARRTSHLSQYTPPKACIGSWLNNFFQM